MGLPKESWPWALSVGSIDPGGNGTMLTDNINDSSLCAKND